MAQVRITGTVRIPGGAPAVGGTVTARLSRSATAADGRVLGGGTTFPVQAPIAADGTVDFLLDANDVLVPSGTVYEVKIHAKVANKDTYSPPTEWWQVPSGGTLDIGAVPRLYVVPGVAVTTAPAVAQAAADAQASATAAAASAATDASTASTAAATASTAKTAAEAARDQALTALASPVDNALATATGSTTARAMKAWVRDLAARGARLTPWYIEGIADFSSGGFEVPAGVTSHPIPSATGYELTLTVTGAAGATSLTASAGPVADAGVTSAGWAAVVQHDDGSWGVYTVTSVVGSTLTIRPALRASVTARTLANLHDSNLGQHWTPTGYVALAEHIWRYPPWKAVRGRVIAQTRDTDVGQGWSLYGGLTAVRVTENNSRNYFAGTGNTLSAMAMSRWGRALDVLPTASGQGLTWTVQLGGRTGYVDTYVGVDTGTNPVRVEIIIDGVTVVDRTTYGLERVAARFRNATTGTIRVTNPSFTSGDRFRVGTTTWWEHPADVPSSLFHPGAKVVYVGDSWGAYYSGAGPAALKTRLVAQGGDLVNVALGGMTAQWARDNWQTLVVANAPDIVVIEFFVNDRNTYGLAGIGTWLANIAWLVDQAIAAGIQPIVLMPCTTAAQSQSSELAQYAASLAEGLGRPIAVSERRQVVWYRTPATINARLAEEHVIPANNATAFTIADPTNGVEGQRLVLRIQNLTASSALGAITWGSAYKLAGAFTAPAAGYSRTVEFRFDGTNWHEIGRAAADVPN